MKKIAYIAGPGLCFVAGFLARSAAPSPTATERDCPGGGARAHAVRAPGAGARRAPPPPPPKIASEPLPLETAPGAAGYDPEKLLMAGVPHREIFAREPRDERWAARREELMRTLLEQQLRDVPGARVAEVSCRLATCIYSIDVPGAAFRSASEGRTSLGRESTIEEKPVGDGLMRATKLVMFSGSLRDNDRYLAWYEREQNTVKEEPKIEWRKTP